MSLTTNPFDANDEVQELDEDFDGVSFQPAEVFLADANPLAGDGREEEHARHTFGAAGAEGGDHTSYDDDNDDAFFDRTNELLDAGGDFQIGSKSINVSLRERSPHSVPLSATSPGAYFAAGPQGDVGGGGGGGGAAEGRRSFRNFLPETDEDDPFYNQVSTPRALRRRC